MPKRKRNDPSNSRNSSNSNSNSRNSNNINNSNTNNKEEDDDNWIEQLAKKAIENEPSQKVLSKEERIHRRNEKKRRRQQQQQQQSKRGHTVTVVSDDNEDDDDRKQKSLTRVTQRSFPTPNNNNNNTKTRDRLRDLSKTIQLLSRVDWKKSGRYDASSQEKSRSRRRRRRADNDVTVQPRSRDYGGLGLARPSLYLPLSDPSFVPKLQQEFAEHIEGFYGKQRTKAMKKQLDRTMLWRQLHNGTLLQNKKKFQNMTPDDKVNALLRAGIL